MAKLPANMVKAPIFDNPIRRTARPDLAVVEQPAPKPAPKPAAAEPPAVIAAVEEVAAVEQAPVDEVITSARELDPDEALVHRFSVRLTQPQWEALQTRCFQLRLRGDKTNAAELIRRIVDDWMARKPATP